MIQTKYLIIIGVIICLIVLYYFYNEIKNVKKLVGPIYQKTMSLEVKLMDMEKTGVKIPYKKNTKRNDSPALSITYHSDMVKNGNLSFKYAEVSDTEANELLKNIDNKKTVQKTSNQIVQKDSTKNNLVVKNVAGSINGIRSNIQYGDFSDLKTSPISTTTIPTHQNNLGQADGAETINFDISRLINKKEDSDVREYQKILDNLSNIPHSDAEDSLDELQLDEDVIKHISESIQYADLPSNNSVSDIPSKKSNRINKKNNYTKKSNHKKL